MLNYLLPIMVVFSLFCAIANGKMTELSDAVISSGADAIDLVIKLTGIICLWNGLTTVAQKSGLTALICKAFSPLLSVIFPRLKDTRAREAIAMNVTANFLGLGNAATPLGLEAMRRLQAINPDPQRATDDMAKFVVMNSAAIHLVPTTIAVLRAEYGSNNPMEILLPALVTSVIALTMGIIMTKIFSKVFR